ncbi:HAD-like domain-containing protein [Massariosphaeria phaeospora]|uniref:HAD-like domain-containing protein n=1 Tax=Massariosphaeria phaeospora TaxID=100035 RepID=A0A7C8I0A4_9PLEO|nr:HAD-like domain-containing protein [Massariosphaeria phaeospora]
MSSPLLKAVIFDLGDVLFNWSADTKTAISAPTLRKILQSPAWFEYECGRLGRKNCYREVGRQFGVVVDEVAEAFLQARASLKANGALVSLIRGLKKDAVKVYAMSNVAKEDFAVLADKMDWALFDRVFTSGAVGMRKPDKDFFRHVLRETCLAAEEIVFVDDKRVNVEAAESVGIRGIVFDESSVASQHALSSSAVFRGHEYLHRNAKNLDSITDTGVRVPDNFAQLLILDATREHTLVNVTLDFKETWNFFAGQAVLVPGGKFPDDLDTTSMALTVLRPTASASTRSMLDKMAECVRPDGTFLTYFDRERPRTDDVVCANVLACFYHYGRGYQFPRTLQHIHDVLLHRTYIDGTRYYPSADCCLGFFVRLLQSAPDDGHLQARLGPVLRSRVAERVGESGSPLDLAMRVLACDALGIEHGDDCRTLRRLQCQDGGWEPGWMYRYGSTGIKIGNRSVTTALAVKAVAVSDNKGRQEMVRDGHV